MTPKKDIMARLRKKRRAAKKCYLCGEEPASEGSTSCAVCRGIIRLKQPWKQSLLPYPEEKFALTEGPATNWEVLRREQGED